MEKSKSLEIQVPERFRPHLANINEGGKSAAEIIDLHQTSLTKAAERGDYLLAQAIDGVTPELDQAINEYLVKLRNTVTWFKDNRSPFTKFLKEIVELFREYEKPLEKGNADGYYDKLQRIRDDYATKLEEDRIKREEQERRERLQDEERARLREDAKLQLTQAFNEILLADKKAITNLLENATLDVIDQVEATIAGVPEKYDAPKFAAITLNLRAFHLEEATVKNIRTGVKNELYGSLAAQYEREVKEYKLETILKIPAKRQELEELAQADAKQKEELERQAAARKEAEEKRLEAERLAAEEAAAAKASEEKAAEVIASGFNGSQGAQEESQAQTIKEYEIQVLGAPGWTLIFSFWIKSDAAKDRLKKDTIGSVKLSTMKAYAERIAKKPDGERIDSEYIKYVPKVKAVAKA